MGWKKTNNQTQGKNNLNLLCLQYAIVNATDYTNDVDL